MNSIVRSNFKVRFAFFCICESRFFSFQFFAISGIQTDLWSVEVNYLPPGMVSKKKRMHVDLVFQKHRLVISEDGLDIAYSWSKCKLQGHGVLNISYNIFHVEYAWIYSEEKV